jgi:Spy/CpxP family protein refolding chaperone
MVTAILATAAVAGWGVTQASAGLRHAGVRGLRAAAVSDGTGGPFDSAIRNMVSGNMGRLITLRAEMNLSPAQREQIESVLRAYRDDAAPLTREMIENKRALREAVLAETPSQQEIQRAAAAIGETIAKSAVLASDISREVRPLLTEAQVGLLEKYAIEHDAAVDRCLAECAELGVGML